MVALHYPSLIQTSFWVPHEIFLNIYLSEFLNYKVEKRIAFEAVLNQYDIRGIPDDERQRVQLFF